MKDLLNEFFNMKEVEKSYLDRVRDRITVCFRCRKIWVRKRKNKMPLSCPYCASKYFNKPRRKDIEKKILKEFRI